MNILDENVLYKQHQKLLNWQVPTRQIGYDFGRKGMTDEDIIPLLIQQHYPTFFTLDFDFYKRLLGHTRYCLVCMDIEQDETAHYIRLLLRHKEFNAQAKRMGKVIRLSSFGIWLWQIHAEKEISVPW